MFNVPCQKCNEKPANVKFTKIENGKVIEFQLCQDCAEEISLFKHKKIDEDVKIALSNILSGLLNIQKKEEEPSSVPPKYKELICKNCGLPYESFHKTFLLGCSECYESFNDNLIPIIRKIHGSIENKGKVPSGQKRFLEISKKINDLRQQLDDAIEMEDYEIAAGIRDKIRELEQKKEQT